jgi:single-strand DNA-binding protein
MADLKMPELNYIIIAGNLTKDPVFRQTTNGTPVINFSIASNRKYRDANNQWQEEDCYVGIVAWNKLAESCTNRLKKGSAVLIDGELQSHVFRSDDGHNRNVVEIKARRIQFLNKKGAMTEIAHTPALHQFHEEEPVTVEDDSFDKFLTSEEAQLLKPQSPHHSQESEG